MLQKVSEDQSNQVFLIMNRVYEGYPELKTLEPLAPLANHEEMVYQQLFEAIGTERIPQGGKIGYQLHCKAHECQCHCPSRSPTLASRRPTLFDKSQEKTRHLFFQ